MFNTTVLLVSLAISIAVLFVPYVRRVSEWLVTIIHELGHSLFAVLTGGGMHGIYLNADGGGEASVSSAGWFRFITDKIVMFAGYSAPLFLGTALLGLNYHNNSQVGLIILIILGVIAFVFLRNLFGIVIMAIYFGIVLGVTMFGGETVISNFILFMGVFLLTRGLWDILMIARHTIKSDEGSDFHLLAERSILPFSAFIWYVIYILITFPLLFIFGAIIIAA